MIPGAAVATGHRPVPIRYFARLKVRMLGNGLGGNPGRAMSFLVGVLVAVVLAMVGFLLFLASSAGEPPTRLLVASFGGAALVIGAALLPLVWFGIDDTLDPARFALLPLSRVRLVLGLGTAALVSVPAAATLAATLGLLAPAAAHGGLAALAVQAVGLVGGLLLCVALSRAVTSAFASMLRSRRMRDLAGILLAVVAALFAPLQFAVIAAVQQADWQHLVRVAEVVGWTPLAAPYTVGVEMAAGRPAAALGKLLVTGAAVAGLLWWWSRTLESAMTGTESGAPARAGRARRAGPVSQLMPRLLPGLPASPFGVMAAREVRYWWRDAKRRANLITIAVVGVLAPVVVANGGRFFLTDDFQATAVSPLAHQLTMLFVASFAATLLANQFGFDGSAFAAHLTTAVRGATELRARTVGHAVLLVPLLLALGVVLALLRGDVTAAPAAWGVMLAGYGAGVGINSILSVLAPYALPEGSNPFATATGSGVSKSMLALLTIVASAVLALPVLLAARLVGPAWPWMAVPVGAGYGLALAALGCYIAGDVLDRRRPEVLAHVSPRS